MASVRFLFLLLVSLISVKAVAAPSCDLLKEAWERRFEREFTTSWNGKEFTCQGHQFVLALALYDLNREYVEFDRSSQAANLFAKVKAATKSIVLSDENHDCKDVIATHFNGTTTICPLYFDQSREHRASTMVHEARHNYVDDQKHVKCLSGAYAENVKPSCDPHFFDGNWQGGGYNADVFFYSWNIRKRTKLNNLSEAVLKSGLRGYIPDHFVNISPAEIQAWRR